MKKRPARSRPLALGYIRVSTVEQATNGASLAGQRATLTAQAERRGWDLEVVADEGLSGKGDVRKRPGLTDALERLDRGEADVLLVTRIDRLSRSNRDFVKLVERAEQHRWQLVMLDPDIDMTTPAGEYFVGLLSLQAQFEGRLISLRTKEALAQRRAEGVRLGRPPVLPAEVRERIALARAGGRTLSGIALDLNAAGIATAHGGARWHASTVAAVLKSLGLRSQSAA